MISAQQLPKLNKDKHKSIVDPLVRVELYGVPADNASKETHYISNNGDSNTQAFPLLRYVYRAVWLQQNRPSPSGFNPTWNHRFQFDVHVPELVMVRFVVEDYDSTSQNDLIGQYCLPLTSIQNGKKQL